MTCVRYAVANLYSSIARPSRFTFFSMITKNRTQVQSSNSSSVSWACSDKALAIKLRYLPRGAEIHLYHYVPNSKAYFHDWRDESFVTIPCQFIYSKGELLSSDVFAICQLHWTLESNSHDPICLKFSDLSAAISRDENPPYDRRGRRPTWPSPPPGTPQKDHKTSQLNSLTSPIHPHVQSRILRIPHRRPQRPSHHRHWSSIPHTLLTSGGASGIGKSIVEYFHSKGAKVVFGDLNDTNGKAIADKLGE